MKSLLARFLDPNSALDASSIRRLYLTLDSADGEELLYVATLLQLCAPSLEAFEFRGAMNVGACRCFFLVTKQDDPTHR